MDDDVATKTLRTEYNLWLERLFGNYVVITQLYCMGRGNFVYDRLHQVMLSLIDVNEAWAWKCVFVVLTFHGVALQKKQCQCLEAYLEAIDELVCCHCCVISNCSQSVPGICNLQNFNFPLNSN